MSRLSFGFLATALVIALALASIQVQLVQAGSVPSEPAGTTPGAVAEMGDTHAGH
jgi:hypothetical protein